MRLCTAFVAALLLLLSGNDALAGAEKTRVRAGLEQNPPLSFIDDQGRPGGLLVDILDRVAAENNWSVDYQPDTFHNCLDKLQRGDLDLMITIAYSEERARLFDFNQVNVISVWGQVYTRPDSTISSFLDLDGMRLAVMAKDIHHRAMRALLEKFSVRPEYVEVDNFEQVFAAVRDGRADAGVVGRFFALKNEEAYRLHPTPMVFNPIEVRYATPKGRHGDLLAAIDTALTRDKAVPDSPYFQALERWLGVTGKRGLPAWLPPTLGGAGILIALLLLFVVLLRRQVRSRTRHLEAEMAARNEAQQALAESERNYRELVEGSNAIILHWNPQGKILFINRYGERLFGYDHGELAGRSVLETIVPDRESDGRDLVAMIHAICEHPEQYAVNVNENRCRDGGRIWISWHNRPVHAADGTLSGILSVGQEVTEQKKAEQARKLLDQAKDEFISTAAHELRTPLTSIIGYAELLRDDTAGRFSPDQRHEFLNEICGKGHRLARIIEDLLDLSRIRQGIALPLHRQPENPRALAERVIAHQQVIAPRHALVCAAGPGTDLLVPLDGDRMVQVLENLIGNACKYSPVGSQVTLTLTRENGMLRFCVADQGRGMTPEQAAHAFEPFYRADSSNTGVGGLGLGLSIVRRIVESHGGRIWIESQPDAGTRVLFTLPG